MGPSGAPRYKLSKRPGKAPTKGSFSCRYLRGLRLGGLRSLTAFLAKTDSSGFNTVRDLPRSQDVRFLLICSTLRCAEYIAKSMQTRSRDWEISCLSVEPVPANLNPVLLLLQ